MSTTRTFGLPRVVRTALDSYRRRWRSMCALRGLLVTLGIFVGSVLAAVAADRALRLDSPVRTILLVAIAATLLSCLVRWVLWPAVVRMTDRQAAMQLGQSFPDVQEDLVSAVELSISQQEGISPALVASALHQIATHSAKVDHRTALPVRYALKAGAPLLAVGLLLTSAYLVRPEAIQNALHRLFRPRSAVPFFTYTNLRVAPGDHVIRTGDTVEVEAETWGRRAWEARLEAHTGSRLLRVKLPCQEGAAFWQSGPLFEDLTYRVLAGDTISRWYRVRVLPPPALENIAAILTTPEYAGSRKHLVESIRGPLEIIQGTTVEIHAETLKRGTAPEFRCTGKLTIGDDSFPLPPGSSGVLCSALFTPMESAEWQIHLVDGFGLESRSPDSIFIKVEPDRLPLVKITTPGHDLLVLPGEIVQVDAIAEDEFGLRDLTLRYQVVEREADAANPELPKTLELKQGGIDVPKLAATTMLNLEELGLSPGDQLEYRAEASDYAAHATLRRSRSPEYHIMVMSEMEHLNALLSRFREMQLALMREAAEQRLESQRAGELAEKARHASVTEEALDAEERERGHAQDTESLAQAMEGLIPQLARNPATPTPLLSGMERMSRAVRSVAQGPMAQATQNFSQAAQASQAQQASALQQAQSSATDAAKQLEELAQAAQQLQRKSILDKLATDAERLATRQRELQDATVPLAVKTVGGTRDDLDEDLNRDLDRLVGMQQSVQEGVNTLEDEIEAAATSLSFSNPTDAATAEEAGEQLESKNVGSRAAEIARQLNKNVLFSQLSQQQEVASSLDEVAETLRRSDAQMEPIVRQLDEFIQRQRDINEDIRRAAVARTEPEPSQAELGKTEAALEREVSEHASALHWLSRELTEAPSATGEKLDEAAVEMKAASQDLHGSELEAGLEHGEKALALLMEARQEFGGESAAMSAGLEASEGLEAALLLQRILIGQKRVHKDTATADKIRQEDPEGSVGRAVKLVESQSGLRVQTSHLEEMLAQFPGAAALAEIAGAGMDVSRSALESGDTGADTRQVQARVIAVLERLMGSQQAKLQGMGLAGARMLVLMQMMSNMTLQPGLGFEGGTNAALLPATLAEIEDEDWRRIRSRFEEELAAGLDSLYPPEFRELLNAYFERLRSEPIR